MLSMLSDRERQQRAAQRNKTENQSETCGLLKLGVVAVKTDARLGLIGPEYPRIPSLEAIGAI